MKRIFALALLLLLAGAVQAQGRVSVELIGLEGELHSNALALLSLYRNRDHPRLSDGRIRTLHRRAPDEIRAALEPFGHYHVEVEGTLEQQEDGHWRARYLVAPGPRLTLGEVDIRLTGAGADDPELQRTRDALTLRPGTPLDHRDHDQARRQLLRTATERGYLDAHFTERELHIDLNRHEARSTLHLETGPRYHFGPLTFHTDVLHHALLERFSPVAEGDPYEGRRLLDLQSALHDSDYFSDVIIEPDHEAAVDQAVPIDITLMPARWQRYTAGIGYGTDTGARLGLGWEHRRLNRRGHRFRFDSQFNEIGHSFATRYRVPIGNPRTDEIDYSLARRHERLDRGDLTTTTAAIGHTNLRGGWRKNSALSLMQERFRLGSEEAQTSRLLMPSYGLSRTWARQRTRPDHGLHLGVQLRGASESLLSDTSFLQGRGELRWIRSLPGDGRLLLRGEAGSSLVSDFHELPASVRFFAGGDQSVRGYAYRSLGPSNAAGDVIGGRHLLVGSAEYEHPLAGKWSAALFYDIGNAIDRLDDPLRRGAGVGLRWQSPVGPVRIDMASALDEPGRPWRLHLRIGPDL